MTTHKALDSQKELAKSAIAAARAVPMEVVQAKGHGHAGTAMGLAPVMHALFHDVMRHDPADPTWEGRDRFVLSAGHASLALYMQLFLTGYGLSLDEIAKARAYGTRTPGHPELGVTPGVEISTGPLGQGLASAVGIAGALWHKQALLGGSNLFDQTVWVVAGDGCLQEGVTSEASSLAGNLQLPNLVVIWDDNDITIDGDSKVSFREDTRSRYRAYGWEVLDINDPENLEEVRNVLEQARNETKPVLVAYRSVIGWPSPSRSGTSAAHAGAFGEEDVKATKVALGYKEDASLEELVPAEVTESGEAVAARGAAEHRRWRAALDAKLAEEPEFAATYHALHDSDARREESVAKLNELAPSLIGKAAPTRSANGKIIQALHSAVPLWGGSADLSGSTSVAVPGQAFSAENPTGAFWNFGIREHAMAAILNGIAIEGTWRPYGSTYMAFSDYLRPALRIGSMMDLPTILVLTHDSVAVGEDGPTHQPVEQISNLRTIPGVTLGRPADAAELIGVWRRALTNADGPLVLALSRQDLPALESEDSVEGATRGAYVAWQSGAGKDLAIIATGSEVSVALSAAKELADQGVEARVVSVPVTTWFDEEDAEYREAVLPTEVRARVAIEAGSGAGWWKYVGLDGAVVGIDDFGMSGPGQDILEQMGIAQTNLLAVIKEVLRG